MPRKQLINGEWMKVCSNADCHKAGIPQPIEGFNKNKRPHDGLKCQCKKCVKVHYANNREHYRARQKAYSARPENKARTKAYNAEYKSRPENKARRRQQERQRWRDDPMWRIGHIVSSRIRKALKLRGKTKGGSTFDHLPYTPKELMEHIEKQFDEHMTWENHGSYWHIDHIRPHASYKYDSLDHPEFQECWALENLRPLEASENIRKNSFYEGKRYYHNEST